MSIKKKKYLYTVIIGIVVNSFFLSSFPKVCVIHNYVKFYNFNKVLSKRISLTQEATFSSADKNSSYLTFQEVCEGEDIRLWVEMS